MNKPTFEPGDEVFVTTPYGVSLATVTYPGATGIPGRVYVKRKDRDGRNLTTNHDPSELELAWPRGLSGRRRID